jgi:large subunit ribosomal protein L6
MSRVGKKLIPIDQNVKVELNDNRVVVSGPNGTLTTTILDFVSVKIEDNNISVSVIKESDKFQKANWGTARAIIANMVTGVSKGFAKEMGLNGVGFKMDVTGDILTLNIGFSHPVKIKVPKEIKLTITKNVLSGTSFDKQLLNNFFGNIHEMKPCDPYKQKGFKFPNRFYVKKVGKKGGKAK